MGYAAFGNDAPGNLLTGFGFYEPFWLVDFSNVCIVLHLVGAFQVHIHTLIKLTLLLQLIAYIRYLWFLILLLPTSGVLSTSLRRC